MIPADSALGGGELIGIDGDGADWLFLEVMLPPPRAATRGVSSGRDGGARQPHATPNLCAPAMRKRMSIWPKEEEIIVPRLDRETAQRDPVKPRDPNPRS